MYKFLMVISGRGVAADACSRSLVRIRFGVDPQAVSAGGLGISVSIITSGSDSQSSGIVEILSMSASLKVPSACS